MGLIVFAGFVIVILVDWFGFDSLGLIFSCYVLVALLIYLGGWFYYVDLADGLFD